MTVTWHNWSGSLRFSPREIAAPANERELASLVRRSWSEGRTLRAVGAGHSSSPLVETSDLLVSLEHFRGVSGHDRERCEATLGAGIRLGEAGNALADLGMAFFNYGNVDYQAIAGAFGTGTHGTGRTLPHIAEHLEGGRLVTGSGEIISFAIEEDADLVRAWRASLGALGILTNVRLRLIPAYRLRKRKWCARTDDCLAAFSALSTSHRHVDFYWYPRSDEVQIRTMDELDAVPAELPFARLCGEEVGWSHEVIPNARELRFEEMEFALPLERSIACFQEVRQRVKERWRATVGWRVLVRTIAADDAYLSLANGRTTVTISLHQNSTLAYQDYFDDIEPIFRAYDGRPHWGKKHSLHAPELRPLYPEWDRFLALRHRHDPGGVFLNGYLCDLLGIPHRTEQA